MASYVSLITNELITNSLEHGLDGKEGEIRLAVSELEEYIVLDFLIRERIASKFLY